MENRKPAASSDAFYNPEAAKKTTKLSVNSDLLEKARELGVDLVSTLEGALALEVAPRCWASRG
jgi:post-segregation antitoxin (ccd killing protein)